jgi:hypothetical protein
LFPPVQPVPRPEKAKNAIVLDGAITKQKHYRAWVCMRKFEHILVKYVPENAVSMVHNLMEENYVNLHITRKRKTKLGDFRPPQNGKPQRITVNHDLNPYSFLVTFLHELAHQKVWRNHKNKVKPHGVEWQKEYQQLLQPFLIPGIFPPDILENLKQDNKKIFASSNADVALSRQLKKFDTKKNTLLIEDLPDNAIFRLSDGRTFRKLHLRRKNYLCLQLHNNRKYIFNPMAEVFPLDEKDK